MWIKFTDIDHKSYGFYLRSKDIHSVRGSREGTIITTRSPNADTYYSSDSEAVVMGKLSEADAT